nr:polysaccharide biosynthesis protein [Thiomicrorhabdus sp.]
FLKERDKGVLPITDERMTRFNITLTDGVKLVLQALDIMWGGEIFVPKIPSYRITDVAEAIAPECQINLIGIRPGEKLHEEMITTTDALNTIEFRDYFVILPSLPLWDTEQFAKHFGGEQCVDGFSYNSGTNTDWLDVKVLRNLISTYLDPEINRRKDDYK